MVNDLFAITKADPVNHYYVNYQNKIFGNGAVTKTVKTNFLDH